MCIPQNMCVASKYNSISDKLLFYGEWNFENQWNSLRNNLVNEKIFS